MNLLAVAFSIVLGLRVATGGATMPILPLSNVLGTQVKVLAERSFSLKNRHANEFVSGVFADNILLTLAYMDGKVKGAGDINWEALQKPQQFTLTLAPQEVFAFHEDVLPAYQGKTIKTTKAHFNAQDGFKFSGLYYGDGVCHIASLIYWTALEAGLPTERHANHDFAPIPEVSKEYGVSIFYTPGSPSANAHQNLYITNTRDSAIQFVFDYDGENLSFKITE